MASRNDILFCTVFVFSFCCYYFGIMAVTFFLSIQQFRSPLHFWFFLPIFGIIFRLLTHIPNAWFGKLSTNFVEKSVKEESSKQVNGILYSFSSFTFKGGMNVSTLYQTTASPSLLLEVYIRIMICKIKVAKFSKS